MLCVGGLGLRIYEICLLTNTNPGRSHRHHRLRATTILLSH